MQETGVGLGQHQLDGQVVHHFGVVEPGQVSGAESGRQLAGQGLVTVERGFHRLGIEALAIAEGHMVAQVEGEGERVVADFPACGQPRDDLAGLWVLVGEGFGHIAQQHTVFEPIHLERVDTDQGGVVAKKGDVQGFARRGVAAR